VATSFSQQEGIDYEETFSPTTRYTNISSLVSLVASMGWNIDQMDVKTTFLNSKLDEEVDIEEALGFDVKDRKAYVFKLNKALYDINKALRAWYASMDAYLQRLGSLKSYIDANLYIKVEKGESVIIFYMWMILS